MNLIVLLRRGDGMFWGGLKRFARALLSVHLPVGPVSRPFFAFLYGLHVGVREGGILVIEVFLVRAFPFRQVNVRPWGMGWVMEFLPYITAAVESSSGETSGLPANRHPRFSIAGTMRSSLLIGDHTFVGHGCSIAVGSSVRIGKHCLLAGGVKISDYDGHPIDAILRRSSPPLPEEIKPVVIGDDVWIARAR